MPIYKVVPIDPNAEIEVEKISDIPEWEADLASICKHNKPLEEQAKRETRESVKKHLLPDQRNVHYYDFGPKLTKQMNTIKRKIKSNCPDGEPTLPQHPDWRSYTNIFTASERAEINKADTQREYKRVIALELEEIIPSNPDLLLNKLKEIKQIRRHNLWLLQMINELGEIKVGAYSDTPPYLQTLELVQAKSKQKK